MLARLREQRAKPAVQVSAPLSQDRILDATEACLREHGYDGTTIRRIAGKLDCAVGTLYRHFSDKRALLNRVTQRRFAPIAEQVEQGGEVRATAMSYVQTAQHEPQQYRLMFWLACVSSREQADVPGVPEVVQRILRGWGMQFDSDARAERFWAQLHGALMLGRQPEIDDASASDRMARDGNGRTVISANGDGREDMTLL